MNVPNPREIVTAEDRAVSPVIGVILMVAITVILAAVIGAVVLEIGEDVEAAPTVTMDVDSDDDNVTISHDGGDTLVVDELQIVIDGNQTDLEDVDLDEEEDWGPGQTLTADDGQDDVDDAEVSLVHRPSGSIIASGDGISTDGTWFWDLR